MIKFKTNDNNDNKYQRTNLNNFKSENDEFKDNLKYYTLLYKIPKYLEKVINIILIIYSILVHILFKFNIIE